MAGYKAPVRDMQFVLNEVMEAGEFLASMPGTEETTPDLINAVLEEAGKVSESLLAPINRQGDEEGCHFENGEVTTPRGFREAYRTFAEGGWIGLSGDVEYGGQGMPKLLAVCLEEMIMGANSAFALYGVLTAGASLAMARHATDELKQLYLPKLYSGEWTATMCLTEAHAGTDLGIIKTKAEPADDGSYRLTGGKIFITGGEHDLTDNIIHMVLAKLPDAPPGPKGISLFLVPKYLPDGDGNPGERNAVSCGSIEHKMGVHGSSTCVMNFDGARAWLVGEPHRGLTCMFTMMNYERLTIGLQGLGLGEASYQTAAAYARERLQGRSPAGAQYPDQPADPIIEHPDVRRMLLTMRAWTESGRALSAWVAVQLDTAHFHPDEAARQRADRLVALLTPVTKTAFSDKGFETCVLGQQVLGGHGYVREWGQEQHVRDARIAQIYEGANGIQALDLMGRKIVNDRQDMIGALEEELRACIRSTPRDGAAGEYAEALERSLDCLMETTRSVKQAAGEDPASVGAASVPYLELMTLVLYCYMWVRMVQVAEQRLNEGADQDFYRAKLHTGRYFLTRLMPRYRALAEEVLAGAGPLMAMDSDLF
ncbi:MAG: acyl-CoA dehydrogenase C-terminal domain-containing protein [Pseudohongiellaceae bacterium]